MNPRVQNTHTSETDERNSGSSPIPPVVLPAAFPIKFFTFPVNVDDVISCYSSKQNVGKLQDGFFTEMARHKQYDDILKLVHWLPTLTLSSLLSPDSNGNYMFHIMAADPSMQHPFRMAGRIFEILMERTIPISMPIVDKCLKTPNLSGKNFYQLAEARGCVLKDDMKGQSYYILSCFYPNFRPPTSAPKPANTNSLVPGATA